MRHPQILVHEGDHLLAELLRDLAARRRWALREVRQAAACLQLLRPGHPSVLVLKLGRDLARELGLLEQVYRLFPDVARIVVGDVEDAALIALAWDLGASYTLFPPQARDQLPELVSALMEAAIDLQPPTLGQGGQATPAPVQRTPDDSTK